ncbi:putative sporulation protein YtaF [Desulfonispora thiosulfatigenes DSM 11270]|uniref:Putative sporulation protein YtaF n=1 Tax=Desulfonispora thiosulfatigenes DSM 11270 TaxID=656914 RepID=A0A1W1VI78_DESTI|nr:sporulation membrane protein YtaF [Desulfonispora thiosulfatigenes]SMB92930.1 putative sporulation protein YtaF [Desulfonispora thiosulfatigenes DSM 11270]
MIWSIVVFAIALSLDGFGVGVSYGFRKIKIPWKSLMIICISSASAIAVSMFAGKMLASILSPNIAEFIGGLALILVGLWLLIQVWANRLTPKETGLNGEVEHPLPVFKISIPSLGLIVNVLKEPIKADLDSSGTISMNESLLLGFALAMDALGAGLGAAMTGFHPVITPIIVGLVKLVLVTTGLYMGSHNLLNNLQKKLEILPGLIILIMGLSKLL